MRDTAQLEALAACFITEMYVTEPVVTDTVQQEAPLGVLLQT